MEIKHYILPYSSNDTVYQLALDNAEISAFIEKLFEQIFNGVRDETLWIESCNEIASSQDSDYIAVSNIANFAEIDFNLIEGIISESTSDIILVKADNSLNAFSEVARITSQGRVAGFCRLFENSKIPQVTIDNNCHYAFFKPEVMGKLSLDIESNCTFQKFIEALISSDLSIQAYSVAGKVYDLSNENDFINLLSTSESIIGPLCNNSRYGKNIIVSKNADIDKTAVIIGPAIISGTAKIEANAVVRSSIVTASAVVKADSFVSGKVVTGETDGNDDDFLPADFNFANAVRGFRLWPRHSYVKYVKRVFDIVFSIGMLLLFAPILLIVAVVIKLHSPGSVFFKARRQGYHGQEFDCLKFRTMIDGADKMQNTLRAKNEVDGPQFKIDDDPRISPIGKFLRDTCIDEIPQFFNVLVGQMSVVGPRPSPEQENLQCPYWRDARLSVKPGITGLWQIKRTREPSKDFQEWVKYDLKYIRKISFWTDLSICFKTAIALVNIFLKQF